MRLINLKKNPITANVSGPFRRWLFGLSPGQISFDRRGFSGAKIFARERLETVGGAFLDGYHTALESGDGKSAGVRLNAVEPELRGFAFEGAAMGFALLDFLTPWRRNRIRNFLSGAGDAHAYMVHVGIGWIWARVPCRFRRAHARLDPLLGWLAFDGWGFHEGFFHWQKYINGQPQPKCLVGYERRVFDQGLGRSLWFVYGANVQLIPRAIANFPPSRQADLWSGIGLAATYAGILSEAELLVLRESADVFQPQLAQGSVFAAKARQRAGNLTDYTNLASRQLCGLEAQQAAHLADSTIENLPYDSCAPAYEKWRVLIQDYFRQSRRLEAA